MGNGAAPASLEVLEPIRIDDPNALVISDTHFPYVHREMLEVAVAVAKKMGVRRVIVAGDIVDMSALSPFPASLPAPSVREELAVAEWYVEFLKREFEEVIGFTGNHDARFARHMSATLSIADLGLPFDALSDLHWMEIGSWLIVHPKNYSRIPGRTAREVAEVEGRNVISGHTHLWGESMTKDGLHMAMEIGCMASGQMPYLHLVKTTSPRIIHGFAVIKDDVGYLFNEARARHFLSSDLASSR